MRIRGDGSSVCYGSFLHVAGSGEELETRSLEEVRPPPASLGFHTLQPVARLLLPALQAA